MHTVGLFEAKQKLSELVERANGGERIGITRRGKLAAVISSPQARTSLKEIFTAIERVRSKVRRRKRPSTKSLIEEGRI